LGALDACRSSLLRKGEGVALQTAVATPSYPKPAVTPVGITWPVLGIHGDICAARATLRTTSEVESAGPLALAEVCATYGVQLGADVALSNRPGGGLIATIQFQSAG
jgi:hypothetical protein